MTPAVTLQTLSYAYGETRALRGLSLTVNSGEMFALVGPDGAGKTTLLRILATVLPPQSGEIDIFGLRLPGQARDLKGRIGYLSQGFSLYGDLSIDENLAFFAELYSLRDFTTRRDELLEFTRLAPFRNRLASRLSGGMKKKLALACALIHKPDLILLDEPTTGVDPVSRRDFWIILGELLNEGLTIVVSTPYLDEAERCDRVGLLNQGSFLTVGEPRSIKREVTGTIYEFVTPRARKARERVNESHREGILETQIAGDKLFVRVAEGTERETVEQLEELLRGEEYGVLSIRSTTPTLENLFISKITEEAYR